MSENTSNNTSENTVSNESENTNNTAVFKVEGNFPTERIEVEQTLFAGQLKNAVAVVPVKPVLPIQGNVLLTIKGDEMTIDATSPEQSITMKVPIANENGWEVKFCLPAKKLNQIVSGLKNERIVIYIDGSKVILQQGRTVFKLNYDENASDGFTLAANDGMGNASNLSLANVGTLATLLAKVALCQSNETDRLAMCGVNIKAEGRNVSLNATDGRKACIADFTKEDNGRKNHNVTIPTLAVTRLQNLLKERADGSMTMAVANKAVHFVFDDCTLRTRIIEAAFPDVRKVLEDKTSLIEVMLDRESLLSCMKQTRLVSPSLSMAFGEDGTISLSAMADDNESNAVTELETESHANELNGLAFNFNSDYLLPFLEKCEDETVELRFAHPHQIEDGKMMIGKLQAYDGDSTFLMMGMKG